MFIEISKSCITLYNCSTVRKRSEEMGVRRGVFALAGETASPRCIWSRPGCKSIVMFVCRAERGRGQRPRKELLLVSFHESTLLSTDTLVSLSLEGNEGHAPPTRLCCGSGISLQWGMETGVKGHPHCRWDQIWGRLKQPFLKILLVPPLSTNGWRPLENILENTRRVNT